MGRVCFHSDDSYSSNHKGQFAFVTAGIALDGIKSEMKALLEWAERRSGKGSKDWHSTKDATIRGAYIEEVIGTAALVGRIFYGAEPAISPDKYWNTRVEILVAAIARYGQGGRCHHQMAHEGLKLASRLQLQKDLKNRGLRRITVESALVSTDVEIRCADALAGFIRAKLFEEALSAQALPGLPDWLVDLSPNKTKALQV